MDFTLAFMCSNRFSCNLNGDTSCILYFFGLGKYTKKSFWSHISALF